MTDQEILDYEFEFDGKRTTLRSLFRDLLLTLWEEIDGFSGKRPFGNSDWCYGMVEPLITTGAIKGTVNRDADGNIEDYDFKWSDANPVMERLIKAALTKP